MENNKLKVAISPISPFVEEKNGAYSGFEIELWEAIAKDMKVDFGYEKHSFQEIIPIISKSEADIAFASITMNEKREELIDFSHPTFNSGLSIMLSKNRSNIDINSSLKEFFKKGYKQFIRPLFYLLLVIFIFGNILFFLERNYGSISHSYFPGVFNATWVSMAVILKTTGNFFVYEVHSWAGRIIMVFAQIASLAALGLVVGSITSFLTSRKIKSMIEGAKDLKGKKVATVSDTTSESVLNTLGAIVIPTQNIDEAYDKLKNNKVDALVFDSPVLKHYLMTGGNKWAELVGEEFDKQDYAFALPKTTHIRKDVNLAILNLRESGVYNALYEKYFGKKE